MYLLGILIVSFIFSIQPFLKSEIMKEFTIDEYTVFTSIIALIIFFISSIFKGLDFTNLQLKSKKSYGLLIIISILTLIYSYVLNLLLKKYKTNDVMPFIRCCEMIWILIISGFIDINDINLTKIFGIILVIIGIYINQKM